MSRRRRRFGTRARVLLIGAAVLLGADCPHHGSVWDLTGSVGEAATAAAEPAMASCHGAPADAAPSEADAPLAIDCECPSCGFEGSVVSIALGALPSAPIALAALPDVRPSRSEPRPTGVWAPPPYPGFFEHTIVLLG